MIINMNGAKAPETPSPVLQEKTVTPETLPTVIGPDEGYDGLTQVTVNPDAQLKAENIRSGKSIFGVVGTFGGASSDSLLSKIMATRTLPRKDPFEGYEVHASDWSELAFDGIVPSYAYDTSRIKYLELPGDITIGSQALSDISSGFIMSGGYSTPKPISLYFTGPTLPTNKDNYSFMITCALESFPMSYLSNVSSEIRKNTIRVTCYRDTWDFPEGITKIEVSGCQVTFIDLSNYSFRTRPGTVILPSTLTYLHSIGSIMSDGANKNTLKLKSLTPPVLAYASTSGDYMPARIIVPAGTLEAYQTADKWSTYANIMEEATE